MANVNIPEYRISVDQLRPGVFIRLEKSNWFSHPFLFNNFKVKDEEQIAVLRRLGVTEIICVPEKSDVLPLSPSQAPQHEAAQEQSVEAEQAVDRLWELKRERTKRLQDKKRRIAECEERFNSSIQDFSNIMKGIVRGNSQSVNEGIAFVGRLTEHFLTDKESTLHLMNVMEPAERMYSHALNVAILSMMVGRGAGLDSARMQTLGIGALFHDIGKTRIEKKLLKKRGKLTRSEQQLMENHPAFGVEILSKIPEFPANAIAVVQQHHERMDGSGYPGGLKGEDIDRLARIVGIADAYDKLCNQPDPDESLTPYLALSYMFGQQKNLFDPEYLALFIRSLGVYPPGTVVQLTNGAIGMVMSVNPNNQLRPSVVLYDSEVPRKEALIVELADEPDLKVEKSIRLAHLPQEIFEYLSPRKRISYFVDMD
ncbi:HD-GYP domain-containing protein [Desulfovibrio oxyclinae]|jgi:putative nucleotidyltransferase with HDIG domain|uniref:HD-GYP domain-containing protein n=1 Tax=Desulfovibrio oxyclinae TaxID=63560 RepID=UPI0003A422EC|nr:HD-GYP domain-containing protein [Desulfovibrio oxyclinae]